MPAQQRQRADGKTTRGFTLAEVLVVTVIVMILATVALTSLGNFLTFNNAKTTVNTFLTLDSAITNGGNTGFDNVVGAYPGHLTDLVNPITTSRTNSCATAYNNGEVNKWAAPYYVLYLGSGGTVTPVGTIKDSLTRSNGTGAGFLVMTVPNVDLVDAQNLDQIIDKSNGASAGALQWTPAAATSGPVTVTYEAVAVANNKC